MQDKLIVLIDNCYEANESYISGQQQEYYEADKKIY